MKILMVIFCMFSFQVKAAKVKSIKMLCLDRKEFLGTIGKSQDLFLVGTMSNPDSLVEVYKGNDLGWSVVVRSHKGICVLVSGVQLLDVDWFRETKLP